MNSDPFSLLIPKSGNGIDFSMSSSASVTHLRALLRMLRFSFQPKAIPAVVNV